MARHGSLLCGKQAHAHTYTVLYIVFVCVLCLYLHVRSTLTQPDEPYPMLVICGPPGSGKGYFCQLLVEEFPNFFGLG